MSDYYKTYFKKTSNLKNEAAEAPETAVVEPKTEVTPPPTPQAPILEEKPPKKGSSWGTKVLIALLLLVITGGGAGGYFYYQNVFLPSQTNKEVMGAKDEKTLLLEEVGKLVILPSDEEAKIYSVVEVDKLRASSPFFTDAQDGDKLLLFSKKAVLYRPSEKKIVSIGPVTQETSFEATSSSELDLNPTPTLFRTVP